MDNFCAKIRISEFCILTLEQNILGVHVIDWFYDSVVWCDYAHEKYKYRKRPCCPGLRRGHRSSPRIPSRLIFHKRCTDVELKKSRWKTCKKLGAKQTIDLMQQCIKWQETWQETITVELSVRFGQSNECKRCFY